MEQRRHGESLEGHLHHLKVSTNIKNMKTRKSDSSDDTEDDSNDTDSKSTPPSNKK